MQTLKLIEHKPLHRKDLSNGYEIRTIQGLLGHKDLNTTMIYTHIVKRGGSGIFSPLDALNS